MSNHRLLYRTKKCTIYYNNDYIFKIYSDKKLTIKEYNITKIFKNHPNIVQVVDLINFEDKLAIVYDRADLDLRNIQINPSVIYSIMIQILLAVEYIHKKNIIHCDLKPENILWFENDYKIKISDFGMSVKNGEKIIGGTKLFLSPEASKNKIATPKVDVWAIGCIFYYLLTNKIYTLNTNLNKIKDIKLRDLLQKLLKKNYKNRITVTDALFHNCFEDFREFIIRKRRENNLT